MWILNNQQNIIINFHQDFVVSIHNYFLKDRQIGVYSIGLMILWKLGCPNKKKHKKFALLPYLFGLNRQCWLEEIKNVKNVRKLSLFIIDFIFSPIEYSSLRRLVYMSDKKSLSKAAAELELLFIWVTNLLALRTPSNCDHIHSNDFENEADVFLNSYIILSFVEVLPLKW